MKHGNLLLGSFCHVACRMWCRWGWFRFAGVKLNIWIFWIAGPSRVDGLTTQSMWIFWIEGPSRVDSFPTQSMWIFWIVGPSRVDGLPTQRSRRRKKNEEYWEKSQENRGKWRNIEEISDLLFFFLSSHFLITYSWKKKKKERKKGRKAYEDIALGVVSLALHAPAYPDSQDQVFPQKSPSAPKNLCF